MLLEATEQEKHRVKGKRSRKQKKRWGENIKERAEINFITGPDGKRFSQSHLWYANDLSRLWDRVYYTRPSQTQMSKNLHKDFFLVWERFHALVDSFLCKKEIN